MEYLNKCKIDETEAKKLYELVGGRIMDLTSVANKFLKDKELTDKKSNSTIDWAKGENVIVNGTSAA